MWQIADRENPATSYFKYEKNQLLLFLLKF